MRHPAALRACSWEARSLWRDLIETATPQATPGVTPLVIGRATPPVTQLARILGLHHHRLRKYLAELEQAGMVQVSDAATFPPRDDEVTPLVTSSRGGRGGDSFPSQVLDPGKDLGGKHSREQGSLLGEGEGSRFDEAWRIYPDRPGDSKADARKAWQARVRAGVPEEQLLDGARRYAAYIEAKGTEPEFVKTAARFFGPGGFYLADYPLPPGAITPEITFQDQAHSNGGHHAR